MTTTGLADLVARLDALAPDEVTLPVVGDLVAGAKLSDRELARYTGARPDRYARRQVHRSRNFDVLVLTWMPGQGTPIHNHAGNLGWVRLVRGLVVEDRFQLVPSRDAQGLDVARDVELPRRGIELVDVGRTVVTEIGAVATVDRVRAIHRISNPSELAGSEVAVTLHVYSRPHDVCLVFDREARTCSRREMRFDEVEAAV